MPLRRTRLVALAAALCSAGVWPALAAEAPPTDPEIGATVNLLSESLRAGGAIPVEVWLVNSSPVAASAVELRLHSPPALTLAEGGCDRPHAGAVDLGPLGAHQVLTRSLRLCAADRVVEDDFTLLFVFRYRWAAAEGERESFTAVEKTVRVGLLGTDSPGGFSLRLVALVLPGLLFWMLLRLFRVPVVSGFSSAESAALAVLTSALLVAVLERLTPTGAGPGISLGELGWLCLVGAVPALVAGLGWTVWQEVRRRRALAQIIRSTDPPATVLAKLLAGARPPDRNASLRTEHDEFLGSMVAASGDGRSYVLVGWFELRPDPAAMGAASRARAGALAEARAAQERGDLAALLAAGRRGGMSPALFNAIRRKQADGSWGTTGEAMKLFAADEVLATGLSSEGPTPRSPVTLP